MLQWNELRITPDGRYLIIDVEVQHLDYYANVYLESVAFNVFNKSEDYLEYPNDKAINVWKDSTLDVYPPNTESGQVKHIRKFIDLDGTNIQNGLFLVYAVANGEPTEDTPCGAKDRVLVGITYNKGLLYKNSIAALGTMNNCIPSKDLIDYILRTKAFELSLATGDYKAAIDYWNGTFKKAITHKNHCGCHGY